MNETLDVLMKRKSVRVFEEKPIGAEEKQAILAAAMRAPCALAAYHGIKADTAFP